MKKLLFIIGIFLFISCQNNESYKDLNGATWYDYKACQNAIREEIQAHEFKNEAAVSEGKMTQTAAEEDNINYKAGLGKYAKKDTLKKN